MRPCASSTSACENAFSKIKAASACQYGISDGFLCENQCRQALSALFIENAFAALPPSGKPGLRQRLALLGALQPGVQLWVVGLWQQGRQAKLHIGQRNGGGNLVERQLRLRRC